MRFATLIHKNDPCSSTSPHTAVAHRLENPIWNTEGRGFESHLGLRFFLCPLMVDYLHLPLFLYNTNISGIGQYFLQLENVDEDT